MDCLFTSIFNNICEDLHGDEQAMVLQNLNVEILPYCMACIECKGKNYDEILESKTIPINIRYFFAMAKGMHAVNANNIMGLQNITLLMETGAAEEDVYDAIHKHVDKNFAVFHAFFDTIVEHYKVDFEEDLDIDTVFPEIAGDGLGMLLESSKIKLKHIICQIQQIMMHNDFEKASNFLISTYLKSIYCQKESEFKSSFEFLNDQSGVYGTALHEGEAEYWAVISTDSFLREWGLKKDEPAYESNKYVLERKMYKVFRDSIINEKEIVHNLFTNNPIFVKNHCLYAEIIKSSDEMDLRAYKKAIAKINSRDVL